MYLCNMDSKNNLFHLLTIILVFKFASAQFDYPCGPLSGGFGSLLGNVPLVGDSLLSDCNVPPLPCYPTSDCLPFLPEPPCSYGFPNCALPAPIFGCDYPPLAFPPTLLPYPYLSKDCGCLSKFGGCKRKLIGCKSLLGRKCLSKVLLPLLLKKGLTLGFGPDAGCGAGGFYDDCWL